MRQFSRSDNVLLSRLRMKWLVLIPLLSLAKCAPVGEQAASLEGLEQEDLRVRRAKEIMMFDNEQDDVKATEKRSDPSMLDDETVDANGDVKAYDPNALAEESPETEEAASMDTSSEIMDGVDTTSDTMSDTEENPGSDLGILQDEQEPGSEEISDAETPTDLVTEDGKNYQDYLKDVEGPGYLKSYMQMLEAVSNPYQNEKWGQLYDQSYFDLPPRSRFQRYRRSQNRRFNNVPVLRRAVKRTRRIKRDLFYPAESLSNEYDPYKEDYLEDPYESYEPSENEELVSLLDLLDSARAYDEDKYGTYGATGYDIPEEYLDDMIYDQEPAYYLPKRQAGLTFVPGIKRARSFYPYFEEPESHFSAFVPQKRTFRDYEDEYERVMRLAAALRDQQQQYPYDYRYQVYRRK